MIIGKLHKYDGEFIGDVRYRFYDESETGWCGELVLTEYRTLVDGDSYIIEISDGRRGGCSLKTRVNRSTDSVPPLYYYHFQGHGLLE